MEHYSLAEVEEGVLSKECVPASLPLPPDWGWLAVEGGGAGVGQLVGPAARLARTHRAVVIAGAGPGVAGAVSLAERVKRRLGAGRGGQRGLAVGELLTKEVWRPRIPGPAPLLVTRRVPTIHILLEADGQPGSNLLETLWAEQ